MEEIQKYYGGEKMSNDMPSIRTTTTTIEEYGKQTVPEGAKIVSVEKNITFKKIENGWLKEVNTYTQYRMKEEDEMETGYVSNYSCRYFTDRPNESQTEYGDY